MNLHLAVTPGFGTPPWVGAVVFVALAMFTLSLTIICFVEAWLLLNGYAPITSFVRSDIDHHHVIATVLLVGIGILVGHFWR